MAQLVEQRIRNAQVAGSSPATSSKKTRFFVKNERVLLFLLDFKCTVRREQKCCADADHVESHGAGRQYAPILTKFRQELQPVQVRAFEGAAGPAGKKAIIVEALR